MRQVVVRSLVSLAAVGAVTYAAHGLLRLNATTVGFAYLLLVLIVASTWGFVESALCAVIATLVFNYFSFPPVGTFTIADPQNWIALFSFLATALIASRLSAKARHRALDAIQRRRDVERLYTFSRAILLIGAGEPFPAQLIRQLAEIFELSAAVLYERRTGCFHRAGPLEFEGLDDQLRDAALLGTSFSDPERNRIVTGVRLGSEPIASLALQGSQMPDSVIQGIANLVAVGLERARAQDLERQVEVARQSEQLRTTLIDAMAHEFKTPLTSIKAATTSLLASPDQDPESRAEIIKIADEEAERLKELIDNAVEMARLDAAHIDVRIEMWDVGEIVREALASMQKEIDDREIEVLSDAHMPPGSLDRRLVKLAVRQLLDNALKYSPPGTPVTLRISQGEAEAIIEITDRGKGIPAGEQHRIFERFYRSPDAQRRIPGSGLGLSIAQRIAHAHGGDLTVESRPGETTFRLTLPLEHQGGRT